MQCIIFLSFFDVELPVKNDREKESLECGRMHIWPLKTQKPQMASYACMTMLHYVVNFWPQKLVPLDKILKPQPNNLFPKTTILGPKIATGHDKTNLLIVGLLASSRVYFYIFGFLEFWLVWALPMIVPFANYSVACYLLSNTQD